MSAPEPSHYRTSSRLSGQNPEFGPLRVNPPMYPSRSASRQSMRTDTKEPEGEEVSKREQDPLSEAEDEPDHADTEVTPTQDPKGKRSEVVIQHSTPMKTFTMPETREDREDREEREAYALIDSMFFIYHYHKPDGPRFEPTPKGLSALAKEITKLAQELPKTPIPGQFPVTPQKPIQHVPTPVIPPTAPQKAREDPSMLSKIGSRIGQELKDTFLPTMFHPGPSKQPSTRLSLPPHQRVPHQIPTSVLLSQAKPLNRPAFHWVEPRPAPRPPSPPDTAWVPPSQQQPPPPTEVAPPPSTPKTPKQVRMSASPGSDPGDSDGSSSSSFEGDTNHGSGKASSRGRRSQSVGSTTSSVFGSSKLKAPKLEKNS